MSMPKIGLMHRTLLWRRRIDPVLLSIAIACFPIKAGLDTIVLGLFVVSGLYLVLLRRRSSRLIDPYYAMASLTYAAVALAIGFYHGDIRANIRWIGLPLYFVVGIPLFAGFALIRDPLRQVTIGARVGLLLTFAMALFESLNGQSRVGLGGNAANAAFIICVIAIMTRFSISNPPRYLPNTRAWFYFALIPVLMTGTRIVVPLFAFAALIDFIELRHDLFAKIRNLDRRRLALLGLIALSITAATIYKTNDIVESRIEYTMREMNNLSADDTQSVTGLDIRITLWRGALRIFREHPFVGVGGNESMRQIKEDIPATQQDIYRDFVHVHFFILDELRDRGLIGLTFLLGFFAVVFMRIAKRSNHETRVNMLVFLFILLLYGSLHGLLLGDRNIAAIILMFVGVLASQRRREINPQESGRTT